MQAQITGDTLLKEDTNYILKRGATVVYRGIRNRRPKGRMYLAHPSAEAPRFLVPCEDTAGLMFVLRMMSDGRGLIGNTMRTLLRIPGGTALLSRIVFKECIVTSL
jgi:hypothetical protein